MERFETIDAMAAPLPIANVDTDKILPARYLTTTRRTGLGTALFADMRYFADGRERSDFILNREPWRHAAILITGTNFGCGSSREHAPWALRDFGIRCIIAPGFADIFRDNCFKNGILLLNFDDNAIAMLMADAVSTSTARMIVDLQAQVLVRSNGVMLPIAIDSDRRQDLLTGRDEISSTLEHEHAIAEWEYGRTPLPPVLASTWGELEN